MLCLTLLNLTSTPCNLGKGNLNNKTNYLVSEVFEILLENTIQSHNFSFINKLYDALFKNINHTLVSTYSFRQQHEPFSRIDYRDFSYHQNPMDNFPIHFSLLKLLTQYAPFKILTNFLLSCGLFTPWLSWFIVCT